MLASPSPPFNPPPATFISLLPCRPYDEQPETDPKYSALPPPDVSKIKGVCVLSCSS